MEKEVEEEENEHGSTHASSLPPQVQLEQFLEELQGSTEEQCATFITTVVIM